MSTTTDNAKELRDYIDLFSAVVKAVEKTFEDKKVRIFDLLHFMPVLAKIRPALEGGDDPLGKFAALSAAEQEDLRAYLVEKLDLSDDTAEELIEVGVWLALTLAAFIVEMQRKGKS